MTRLFHERDRLQLPVSEWIEQDYACVLVQTGQSIGGKTRLAYLFMHEGRVIFSGDDFYASPIDPIEHPKTMIALLHFLSLQDGDTDSEYFDTYTGDQIEWRDMYAEDVANLVHEWEESIGEDVRVLHPKLHFGLSEKGHS